MHLSETLAEIELDEEMDESEDKDDIWWSITLYLVNELFAMFLCLYLWLFVLPLPHQLLYLLIKLLLILRNSNCRHFLFFFFGRHFVQYIITSIFNLNLFLSPFRNLRHLLLTIINGNVYSRRPLPLKLLNIRIIDNNLFKVKIKWRYGLSFMLDPLECWQY